MDIIVFEQKWCVQTWLCTVKVTDYSAGYETVQHSSSVCVSLKFLYWKSLSLTAALSVSVFPALSVFCCLYFVIQNIKILLCLCLCVTKDGQGKEIRKTDNSLIFTQLFVALFSLSSSSIFFFYTGSLSLFFFFCLHVEVIIGKSEFIASVQTPWHKTELHDYHEAGVLVFFSQALLAKKADSYA